MEKLYSKVYGWLFAGLLLTFATGMVLSNYENAIINLMSGASYIFIILIELGVAFFFSARIHKMSKQTAIFCYLLYSFITGITFSTLFIAFELKSLILVFLVTAIVFGLFALFGTVTKMSLDKLGNILLMMLIGIIIASIINIFVGSSTADLVVWIHGMIAYIGNLAYDTKKLQVIFDS